MRSDDWFTMEEVDRWLDEAPLPTHLDDKPIYNCMIAISYLDTQGEEQQELIYMEDRRYNWVHDNYTLPLWQQDDRQRVVNNQCNQGD